MANALKNIRYRLEYMGVRLALGLMRAIPYGLAAALARALASVGFLCLRSRRVTAIDNILQGGITDSPREAKRIARNSFYHFALLTVESLRAEATINEHNWRDHIELDLPDDVVASMADDGKGIILATAHLGNWEVAGQVLSFLKPVVAVARRMNNPHTDALIQNRKLGHRFRLIPKHEASGGELLRVLREGNVLAMLVDQHANRRGMPIMLLGRPAATYTSPALLHIRSGAPICFGYCARIGRFRYRMHAIPLIRITPTDDREADIRRILESMATALEAGIRRYPEQYLWAHRRWRVT
ncbi:MAG: lysophospholipid acyltransferase family protein [Verrucomicrobia bacterium]|nr:lysophospholipid acyltransferase family protein [Verrucomicrobiota bacterium]